MIILPIFQRNRRDSLQRKQNSRMLQFPSINGHRLQIIFSVFRSHCFHLANRDVGRFHRHARGKKHDRLNRETKKRSFERSSSHVRKHSWRKKNLGINVRYTQTSNRGVVTSRNIFLKNSQHRTAFSSRESLTNLLELKIVLIFIQTYFYSYKYSSRIVSNLFQNRLKNCFYIYLFANLNNKTFI